MGIREDLGVQAVDNLMEEGGIVLSIHGDKGSGKTTLAGTMADCEYVISRASDKAKPVLMMDVEGGARAIRHRHDVEFSPILDWPSFERYVDKIVAAPELPWGGIFIDNATELAELNMAKILKDAKKVVPEWPEFRKNTTEMTTMVRKLRDIARARGIAVVFNVWDFQQTDDSGNIRKVRMDMTPRLMGRFAGAVDMIAWLEVLDDEPPSTRVLHLAGTSKVQAKFRKAPSGPEADIPWDLYWRNPEVPENSPLVSLLNTLLGGMSWPKDRHLAPTGVRGGLIRRAAPANAG